jgi:hypothetical protein
MARPYLLKPHFSKRHNKWMLNLPPKVSPSGKREHRFFTHHHEALAEANRIRMVFRDYGRSIKMLPANRPLKNRSRHCAERAQGRVFFWERVSNGA